MKVLVTGASGFIGSHLLDAFRCEGDMVAYGTSRKESPLDYMLLAPGLTGSEEWSTLLCGFDVVVHAAARAHSRIKKEQEGDVYKANVSGALALADGAVRAKVKRFVYISSIGVNGDATFNGERFTEFDAPLPSGEYAFSKYRAELALKEFLSGTDVELVIIRPPLVYGPNAPGNFGLLTRVVAKGIPLPLARINNQRSFLSVWNLVDFIRVCLDHPRAAGETFVVSDGKDVSTSELLEKIGHASGKKVKLFWMPVMLLKLCAILLNRRDVCDKLFGSLQVDPNHAKKTLDWEPPLSFEEGVERCF